ncbi:MAG: DUF3450 domain-containing protein [Myxococcota bacterium]
MRDEISSGPLLAVFLYAVATPGGAAAGTLEQAIEKTVIANAAAARSQRRVNELNDATSELTARYRAELEQIESLKVYNHQLETLTASQEAESENLRRQIDTAVHVAREMTPLMLRMLSTLDSFVELDVPFLPEERRERLGKLRDIMARADVTDSEKYRRILEAYQVENEYGRTIEAYQGTIDGGAGGRTVNFLRIGRLLLIYQTLDGKESGVWETSSRSWRVLPSEYRTAVRKGLRIARKQAAPDLIRLPVPAPEDAR